jgi:hypothetical protein
VYRCNTCPINKSCGQNEGWILIHKFCPSRYADFVVKYDKEKKNKKKETQISVKRNGLQEHFIPLLFDLIGAGHGLQVKRNVYKWRKGQKRQ